MNQICKNIIGRASLLTKLNLIKNFSTTSGSQQFKCIAATTTLNLNKQSLFLANPIYRKFYSTEANLTVEDDERPRYKKPFSYNDRGGESRRFGGENRSFSGKNRYASKFDDSRPKKFASRGSETSSTVEDFAGAEQIETTGAEINYETQGKVKFTFFLSIQNL
jgi:hypothetical protein